jgi:hypothetical protein
MTGPRKKAGASGKEGMLTSPLHLSNTTFNITADRDSNSLFAQGWNGDKPCFMTVNTGASITIARMARKEVKLMPHAANGIWEDPPHPKGSLSGTDPGKEPQTSLGALRRNHR